MASAITRNIAVLYILTLVRGELNEFRFATWNILSVQKCTDSGSGFPGMDKKAEEIHNTPAKMYARGKDLDIEGYGTNEKAREMIEFLHATNYKETLKTRNKFIGDSLANLFAWEKSGGQQVDVLLLQEIDLPMLNGLKHLKRGRDALYSYSAINPNLKLDLFQSSKKLEFKPTDENADPKLGDKIGTFSIEDHLKLTYSLSKGGHALWKKPGTDWAYIVAQYPWTVETCETTYWKAPGYHDAENKWKIVDMNKIGVCKLKHKDGTEFNVAAMHADGDIGFTDTQAEKVGELGLPIQFIFGDMNIHKKTQVQDAIKPLGEFVMNDELQYTVYRRIHPYRKIIQNYENNGGNLKLQTEFAAIENHLKGLKGNRGELIDGLITKYKTALATGPMAPNKWYADDNPGMFKSGKLVPELFDMMINDKDIYNKLINMNDEGSFDSFPSELGMDRNLKMEMTNKTQWDFWKPKMKVDVKREDWILYVSKLEKSYYVSEDIVFRKKLESIKETADPFPVKEWPSDHLPVILNFTKKKTNNMTSTKQKKKHIKKKSNTIIRRMLRTLLTVT